MKNINVAILFVCSVLMSSCATTGFNIGQKETADISVYYLEEVEQLQPSDTKMLVNRYLNTEAPDQLFISEEDIAYYVSDENVNNTLQQDLRTGNFTFKKMGNYMGDFRPDLPSADKSQELAVEYLRQNEIYPEDSDQLKLVHQGGLRSATVDANNQRQTIIDKAITLNYGRMVDGLNVIGPGSKIVVQVGDEGEIIGLVKRWREVTRKDSVSQSQLISQAKAERQAEQQITKEYGDIEYRITNTFKAYYDNNGKILQPVFGFEVMLRPGEDLGDLLYLCVIPMLKNSPEKLNLRQVDPRAREMLRQMSQGQNTDDAQGDID